LSGRNVPKSGCLRSKLSLPTPFSINSGNRPYRKKRLPGPSPIGHNRNSSDRVKTVGRKTSGRFILAFNPTEYGAACQILRTFSA
jgi:hypothetical protein